MRRLLLFTVLLVIQLDRSAAKLELVQQKLTAIDAEGHCQSKGGHLVSIHSEQENNEVHQLCSSVYSNCWIGLHTKTSSELWTDGSKVDYRNFHTGQPDGTEHCTMIMSFLFEGKWVDEACTAGYDLTYFVCKYDDTPVATQPVVTLEPTTETTKVTTPNIPSTGTTQHITQVPTTMTKSTTQNIPTTQHQTKVPTTMTKSTTQNMATTPQTQPIMTPKGTPVPTMVTSTSSAKTGSYKLHVNGSHFTMNNRRVFLSGANQAWVAYAYDFGDNQYQYRKQKFEQVLDEINKAGGNSIRVWIHIEGETSPAFDNKTGMVTGLDIKGTFINDMREYLQAARRKNILVFPTLWNGAVKQSFWYRLDGLIKNTTKLQSYLDNGLVPMVTALKDEPALGGWDIMNEPEGKLIPGTADPDPCYDTTPLQNQGPGWAGKLYTAQEIARFLNWQADAIRRADPDAMVTVGAWSELSDTDNFGLHNLYRDECLVKAGGKKMGNLTFYSIHTYSWNNKYNDHAPFLVNATDYGLGKPIVIAEFNRNKGAGMSFQQQFDYAYNRGYTGAWSWSQTDGDWPEQQKGMSYIRNRNDQNSGGMIGINLN